MLIYWLIDADFVWSMVILCECLSFWAISSQSSEADEDDERWWYKVCSLMIIWCVCMSIILCHLQQIQWGGWGWTWGWGNLGLALGRCSRFNWQGLLLEVARKNYHSYHDCKFNCIHLDSRYQVLPTAFNRTSPFADIIVYNRVPKYLMSLDSMNFPWTLFFLGVLQPLWYPS